MYDGEFEMDKFSGQGIMYDSKGEIIYSGRWIDGDPADDKKAQKFLQNYKTNEGKE